MLFLFLHVFFYSGQLLRLMSTETHFGRLHLCLRLVGSVRKEWHILGAATCQALYLSQTLEATHFAKQTEKLFLAGLFGPQTVTCRK